MFKTLYKPNNEYHDKSASWYEEMYYSCVKSKNIAILVASVSSIITVVSVITLASILPLKEKVPYVVYVNEKYGHPVLVKVKNTKDIEENELLKKNMIRKFINARESFNRTMMDENLKEIHLIGSADVYDQFKRLLVASRPDSPFNTFKSKIRDITDIEVIPLNDNRAIVNFKTVVQNESNGRIDYEERVTADIGYKFSQREFNEEDAELYNPVGFEVTHYRTQTTTNANEE
ncbi:MAG: virB8 family protein [Gammaproteobacteria bacterium]